MSHDAPPITHEVNAKEIECFKHHCRSCNAMEFIPRASDSVYPRCCTKPMAFLGIAVARPGRDVSLVRKSP